MTTKSCTVATAVTASCLKINKYSLWQAILCLVNVMLSGSLRGHRFPWLLPSGEAARSQDSRATKMTATNSCSPLSAAEEYVKADWGDSELKKNRKGGREKRGWNQALVHQNMTQLLRRPSAEAHHADPATLLWSAEAADTDKCLHCVSGRISHQSCPSIALQCSKVMSQY